MFNRVQRRDMRRTNTATGSTLRRTSSGPEVPSRMTTENYSAPVGVTARPQVFLLPINDQTPRERCSGIVLPPAKNLSPDRFVALSVDRVFSFLSAAARGTKTCRRQTHRLSVRYSSRLRSLFTAVHRPPHGATLERASDDRLNPNGCR